MLPLSAPAPGQDLSRRVRKLTCILDVAKAMMAQRELDALLALILREAAEVVDADRCSLFLLDRERNELWSKLAQGARGEIRLPVGSGIAGSVAKTGEVINIPDAYSDKRFNRAVDAAQGYRTHSILCVPMRDASGELTGVLQALNKRESATFDSEDQELLLTLGGQAAVAIENAVLHQEINHLFEGFVSASVVAIEARDPTTAGHSGRVATLTLELARCVEHAGGPYHGTRFTEEELQELRYASLLHDFGKVGVREPVLVKAEKLYPHQLELLRTRFELARKDRQLESCQHRLALATAGSVNADLMQAEETRLKRALAELDDAWEFIQACNRPTVLPRDGFERLGQVEGIRFRDSHGQVHAVLGSEEICALSIPKGTLSPEERREIESHVVHTYRFLKQIPWTRALRRVPEIAYAHHEKLDGTGYPRALPSDDIPLQSKMMTVADIYDALTASDRPYKRAIPHEKALDILHAEAKSGQVDPELLKVFIEAQIPKRVTDPAR